MMAWRTAYGFSEKSPHKLSLSGSIQKSKLHGLTGLPASRLVPYMLYNSGHDLEHASMNISDWKIEKHVVNHQSHVLANQSYSCNVSGLRVSDSLAWLSISTESQLSFMDSISMLVVRVFRFLRSWNIIMFLKIISSIQYPKQEKKNAFFGLS